MMSELIGDLLFEMLRFDLSGQFMWLILFVFFAYCLRLTLRGANDAWVQSAASTLLSLGVLGTFAGIVQGLSGFSTSSSNSQIGEVLAGLGTAFYSSLLAMALSLVFKCIQVRSVQKLHDSDEELVSDDLGERLVAETSNGVKQLRQISANSREHSEYLIHITNAVADASDPHGLLGQIGQLRQASEQQNNHLLQEIALLRKQAESTTGALMLLHEQQEKAMVERQFSQREIKSRVESVQQALMTMPNRRDFRALSVLLLQSRGVQATVQKSVQAQSQPQIKGTPARGNRHVIG